MKLLTRQEEQILLAILHLGENAYLVSIREKIKELTGKYLDVGTINKPLKRLHERGLLLADVGESSPSRGGKAIRYYKLTQKGYDALHQVHESHQRFWNDVTLPVKPS